MLRRSVLGGFGASTIASATRAATPFERLEARLSAQMTRDRVPGLSAAVARAGRIEWSRGLGLADIAAGRKADAGTLYHLASLTKPFASTVLLQLVNEGKVSLDDPVSRYGVVVERASEIRVRHLLSHTSEGEPGARYAYSGDRFALLDGVIAQAAGKPFAFALQERITGPLGLRDTAPNPQHRAFTASGLDRAAYEARMARGYAVKDGRFEPVPYPGLFGGAAGLVSSVGDICAFSAAIDEDRLLPPALKAQAFTAAKDARGRPFPYGLGWFVTMHRRQPVVWHYGYWTAISSLIVKLPKEALTYVLLANGEGLSATYPLGAGKLDPSPWARAFLEGFG